MIILANPIEQDRQKMPDENLFGDSPTDFLNMLAEKEAHSRKPIYRVHKWWARRLSSVFRMIILSTLDASPASEIGIWKKYYSNYHLGGKIVLDPFMGGGTVLVEALKLGCRVIGTDINPLAWFITKKEIEHFQQEELVRAYNKLENSIGKFIKSLYKTRCSAGHDAEIIHVIWCKTVVCSYCGQEINLMASYIIQKVNSNYTVCCPNCRTIVNASELDFKTTCPSCFSEFDPNNGSVSIGHVTCPKCFNRSSIETLIKDPKSSVSERMLAIEYYCPICGKGLKAPDQYDELQYQESKLVLQNRRHGLIYPRVALKPSSSSEITRLKRYGINYYYQLFNDRQLLCLSLLLEEIIRIDDQSLKEYLLLAFSDCLSTNNKFCRYESNWGKIGSIFGFQSYSFIPRYGENNVWGGRYGRGTFSKCFMKLLRGKQYAKSTYDVIRLPWENVKVFTGSSLAYLVDGFGQLFTNDKTAFIAIHDNTDLSHIPSNKVDAIITDPPYLDTVNYSELADFFYVWLRIPLKQTYPEFKPKYSSRNNEMIMLDEDDASKHKLKKLFSKSLKECARVLKPDGILVLTFHHSYSWAWAILANALWESGFAISKRSVVRSEGKGGFHGKKGAIKFDACFVCQQGLRRVDKSLQEIVEETCKYAETNANKFESACIKNHSSAHYIEIVSKLLQDALSSKAFGQIGDIHSTASWIDEALLKIEDHS